MKTESLKDLEKQHADALTRAASYSRLADETARDAYNSEAMRWGREAEIIASRINDWHERANPTQ
jgi:hypothetical protein